jgi:hypothetical protein
MKKVISLAAMFLIVAAVALAQTFSGRLVDAVCKASNEGQDSFTASCGATAQTHLFAIELTDAKVLTLDAAGNEKASNAIKDAKKSDLRAVVTGSLEGQIVKVDTLEVR